MENPGTSKPRKKQRTCRGTFRSIAVYNYKGGCCKTFLTRELAASAVVKSGLKVGMIDLDGQCNLTTWFLGGDLSNQGYMNTWESASETEEEGWDSSDEQPDAAWNPPSSGVWQYKSEQFQDLSIDAFRQDNRKFNILHAMQDGTNKQGGSPLIVTEDLKGVEEIKHLPPSAKAKGGKLFLLPGSQRIIAMEVALQNGITYDQYNFHILSFRAIINKFREQFDLDMVIVDCSPSSGILNKVCVMSCDYILPPAKLDTNNLCSMHGFLTAVLPDWLNFYKILVKASNALIKEANREEKSGYEIYKIHKEAPKLLPIVVIGFNAKQQKGTGIADTLSNRQLVYSGAAKLAKAFQDMFTLVKEQSDEAKWTKDDLKEAKLTPDDQAGFKKVVKCLAGEKREENMPDYQLGVQVGETYHVWKSVVHLHTILDTSSHAQYPITWMSNDEDRSFYNNTVRKAMKSDRVNGRAQRNQAKRVYRSLTTIVQHILSLDRATGQKIENS